MSAHILSLPSPATLEHSGFDKTYSYSGTLACHFKPHRSNWLSSWSLTTFAYFSHLVPSKGSLIVLRSKKFFILIVQCKEIFRDLALLYVNLLPSLHNITCYNWENCYFISETYSLLQADWLSPKEMKVFLFHDFLTIQSILQRLCNSYKSYLCI